MNFLFIFFIFSNAIFFPEPWFFMLHTVLIPNIDHLWQQIWISQPFCLGYVKYLSIVSHLAGPTEFRNGLTASLFSDNSFWSKYFSLQRLQNIFFPWIKCSVTINYLLVYDSSSISLSAHRELYKSNQEQSNLQFSPRSTFCLPVDSVCADIGSVIFPFLIFLEYIN